VARITILGGTGYAGAALAAESAMRGHDVTVVSRTGPADPVPGVQYVTGSVLDASLLDEVVAGRDVVISALSPRGDMAGKVEDVLRDLARRVEGTPTRVAHIGGASSLLVEPGGPRLWDVTQSHIPDDVKPEVETGMRILDDFRATPDSVDWFYVSPAEKFGAWVEAPVTGSYRLGGDVLVRDEAGESTISAGDLALAVVDEIEQPAYRRKRFTAAH
jgi:uncharacterized protein